MTTGPANWYVGALPTTAEIDGHVFYVQVHLAQVEGRTICVGVDLRSFVEAEDGDEPQPTNEAWVEVTSPIVRGLRVAEVIEKAATPLHRAFEPVTEHLARLAEQADSREDPMAERLRAGVSLVQSFVPQPPTDRRRGPRPQLDDQALQVVVAAAYLGAVKRPVQAVRAALEASGALRPPVTIDQARKAVTAARARGFIPPARKSTRQQGEQS